MHAHIHISPRDQSHPPPPNRTLAEYANVCKERTSYQTTNRKKTLPRNEFEGRGESRVLEERNSGQIFRGWGIERVVVNFLEDPTKCSVAGVASANSVVIARRVLARSKVDASASLQHSPAFSWPFTASTSFSISSSFHHRPLFHSFFFFFFFFLFFLLSIHLPRLAVALIKCCALGSSSREKPSLHLHGRLVEAAREDIALMNLSREWYEEGGGGGGARW